MNLILDIDSTLIDSIYVLPEFKYQYPDPDFISDKYLYVYKRPYLYEFLEFCFNKFNSVSIWTAGNEMWLNFFLDNILSEKMKNKIKYKLCDKHCKQRKIDINGAFFLQHYKNLKKIWKYKSKNPFTAENTIIIDDSPTTFSNNYFNALLIKKFHYCNKEDDSLKKMIKILKEIKLPIEKNKYAI